MPDGVLEPDNGHPVPPAEGDELVHLDQALAVELAADARIVGIFGIVLPQKSLAVADDSPPESVDFDQPGVDLGAVARTVFHVLAAVHQTGQDLVEIIHLLLVEGHQAVEVLGGKRGGFGFGHPEKFGIVGRHVLHVVLESVQHLFLFSYTYRKKPVSSWWILTDPGGLALNCLAASISLGPFQVEIALGRHAAQMPPPPTAMLQSLWANRMVGLMPW
jgi:hypothetical protein